MKKLTILLTMFCFNATAQEVLSDSVELGMKTKIQLTEIYLQEVQRVTTLLKTDAFVSMNDDVPSNKYTIGKNKKVENSVKKYNEVMAKEYRDLIPYADKVNIIQSIMYLREVR